MASFTFDHSKPGLRKIFNEYQELAIRYVWEVGAEGVDSRKVWGTVSEHLTARADELINTISQEKPTIEI